MATDASNFGLGVVAAKFEQQAVAKVGRTSEKSRFKDADATRAREHALALVPNMCADDSLDATVDKLTDSDILTLTRRSSPGFPEVPVEIDVW